MNKLPPARHHDLVEQELGKEILIYDLLTHKAYNLNETSAIVYQACGDGTAFNELKRKHKFTDELIFFALDELKRERLIEEGGEQMNHFGNLNRREVIRRVGLASMVALPIITALTAPTAAMSQSLAALGQTCTSSGECAPSAPNCNSGHCCVGTGSSLQGTIYGPAGTACAPGGNFCSTSATTTCCSGSATQVQCKCTGPGGTVPCTLACSCN